MTKHSQYVLTRLEDGFRLVKPINAFVKPFMGYFGGVRYDVHATGILPFYFVGTGDTPNQAVKDLGGKLITEFKDLKARTIPLDSFSKILLEILSEHIARR